MHIASALLLGSGLLAPPSSTPEHPGFAIIAPAAWKSTLEPYVAARGADFRVELAQLESIVAGGAAEPGGDAPERIKRWLFRGWKERGLRYVLLVGDADVMPVRFMALDRRTEPAFDYSFYACDLYYADVADANGEFDSWNRATDDFHARYFGEVRGEKNKDGPINFDGVSYVPELAVGRWPVSDADSLAAVVKKTLAWQPSAKRPVALALHAAGWIDARDRAAAMVASLAAAGFETQRQFFGDESGGPSRASVARALAGGVDLVLHLGHGSPDGWERCFGPAEADGSKKCHPAVFFSIGCSTAEFCTEAPYGAYVDEAGGQHPGTIHGEIFHAPPPPPASLQPGPLNTTGVGERLLRMPQGGAIAYLGCNTGAQPCALSLMEGFAGALAAHADAPIGDAWRYALAYYWTAEHLADLKPDPGWYPPAIFFQGMKFMLFGDPTLRLKTSG